MSNNTSLDTQTTPDGVFHSRHGDVTKLTTTNYKRWSSEIKLLLQATKLWDTVLSTDLNSTQHTDTSVTASTASTSSSASSSSPSSASSTGPEASTNIMSESETSEIETTEAGATTQPEASESRTIIIKGKEKAYVERRARAVSFIYASLTEEIKGQVHDLLDNPVSMWNTLRDRFAYTSTDSSEELIEEAFQPDKMKENESFNTYIARLISFQKELAFTRYAISDEKIIQHAIHNLPPTFAFYKQHLRNRPSETQTLNNLIHKLNEFEQSSGFSANTTVATETTAMISRRGQGRRGRGEGYLGGYDSRVKASSYSEEKGKARKNNDGIDNGAPASNFKEMAPVGDKERDLQIQWDLEIARIAFRELNPGVPLPPRYEHAKTSQMSLNPQSRALEYPANKASCSSKILPLLYNEWKETNLSTIHKTLDVDVSQPLGNDNIVNDLSSLRGDSALLSDEDIKKQGMVNFDNTPNFFRIPTIQLSKVAGLDEHDGEFDGEFDAPFGLELRTVQRELGRIGGKYRYGMRGALDYTPNPHPPVALTKYMDYLELVRKATQESTNYYCSDIIFGQTTNKELHSYKPQNPSYLGQGYFDSLSNYIRRTTTWKRSLPFNHFRKRHLNAKKEESEWRLIVKRNYLCKCLLAKYRGLGCACEYEMFEVPRSTAGYDRKPRLEYKMPLKVKSMCLKCINLGQPICMSRTGAFKAKAMNDYGPADNDTVMLDDYDSGRNVIDNDDASSEESDMSDNLDYDGFNAGWIQQMRGVLANFFKQQLRDIFTTIKPEDHTEEERFKRALFDVAELAHPALREHVKQQVQAVEGMGLTPEYTEYETEQCLEIMTWRMVHCIEREVFHGDGGMKGEEIVDFLMRREGAIGPEEPITVMIPFIVDMKCESRDGVTEKARLPLRVLIAQESWTSYKFRPLIDATIRSHIFKNEDYQGSPNSPRRSLVEVRIKPLCNLNAFDTPGPTVEVEVGTIAIKVHATNPAPSGSMEISSDLPVSIYSPCAAMHNVPETISEETDEELQLERMNNISGIFGPQSEIDIQKSQPSPDPVQNPKIWSSGVKLKERLNIFEKDYNEAMDPLHAEKDLPKLRIGLDKADVYYKHPKAGDLPYDIVHRKPARLEIMNARKRRMVMQQRRDSPKKTKLKRCEEVSVDISDAPPEARLLLAPGEELPIVTTVKKPSTRAQAQINTIRRWRNRFFRNSYRKWRYRVSIANRISSWMMLKEEESEIDRKLTAEQKSADVIINTALPSILQTIYQSDNTIQISWLTLCVKKRMWSEERHAIEAINMTCQPRKWLLWVKRFIRETVAAIKKYQLVDLATECVARDKHLQVELREKMLRVTRMKIWFGWFELMKNEEGPYARLWTKRQRENAFRILMNAIESETDAMFHKLMYSQLTEIARQKDGEEKFTPLKGESGERFESTVGEGRMMCDDPDSSNSDSSSSESDEDDKLLSEVATCPPSPRPAKRIILKVNNIPKRTESRSLDHGEDNDFDYTKVSTEHVETVRSLTEMDWREIRKEEGALKLRAAREELLKLLTKKKKKTELIEMFSLVPESSWVIELLKQKEERKKGIEPSFPPSIPLELSILEAHDSIPSDDDGMTPSIDQTVKAIRELVDYMNDKLHPPEEESLLGIPVHIPFSSKHYHRISTMRTATAHLLAKIGLSKRLFIGCIPFMEEGKEKRRWGVYMRRFDTAGQEVTDYVTDLEVDLTLLISVVRGLGKTEGEGITSETSDICVMAEGPVEREEMKVEEKVELDKRIMVGVAEVAVDDEDGDEWEMNIEHQQEKEDTIMEEVEEDQPRAIIMPPAPEPELAPTPTQAFTPMPTPIPPSTPVSPPPDPESQLSPPSTPPRATSPPPIPLGSGFIVSVTVPANFSPTIPLTPSTQPTMTPVIPTVNQSQEEEVDWSQMTKTQRKKIRKKIKNEKLRETIEKEWGEADGGHLS